ncbi:rod shape-determining protein MreD [Calothrix sp. UHCC 0171]|uniref:rod shape-determining protein MreD n=1 Tax=Calothrix sp. UHCC 0171 TaxID=3110245 RepID=UPI002B20C6D6|nr:rod shape-determining protein MreD [Calothrix sp. UHCC 0171]MEA5574533.1 rod shape-determining protein MreD [Calothrix sp. UHCC 0171]
MKTLTFWGKRRSKTPKSYSSSPPRKSKPQPRKSPTTGLFNIKIKPIAKWNPRTRQIVDYSLIFFTVLLCLMLLPNRLPGMELLGIGPNWLLIWVVVWSVKRNAWQGAVAGIILGFLQDAMTYTEPTHALSLGLVGFLTGLMQKQRFIQEDFISIALIVFAMSAFGEAIFASQLVMAGDRNPTDIWAYYQRVALASAILSSLWAPVVYYPLNRWWQKLKLAEQN